MIRKLDYPGTNLKTLNLYVAENSDDVRECVEMGIPYIKWNGPYEVLIKALLMPILRKRFPMVKVDADTKYYSHTVVLHDTTPEHESLMSAKANMGCETGNDIDGNIAGVAENKRWFSGDGSLSEMSADEIKTVKYKGAAAIAKYAGEEINVDVEALISLDLAPHFIGEISECIRRELYGFHWTEGYNKKLKVPIGNFDAAREADNLIILDISGSIPMGISSTMLLLLGYMREKLRADVIVTGTQSYFWEYGEELPDPGEIRTMIGRGNEAAMFVGILKGRMSGKRYDNVISFGDNDSPYYFANMNDIEIDDPDLGEFVGDVEVGNVYHYHTRSKKCTGYGEWANSIAEGDIKYDDEWVNWVER